MEKEISRRRAGEKERAIRREMQLKKQESKTAKAKTDKATTRGSKQSATEKAKTDKKAAARAKMLAARTCDPSPKD